MEFATTNNNLVTIPSEQIKAEAGNGQVEDEVFRSMKINQESKTPYSDATQVRKLSLLKSQESSI